jgi:hypothetical protein
VTKETGTLEGGDYEVRWVGETAEGPEAFHECMRHDLPIVASSDRIYLLPGWQASKGALAEVDVALACGVEVWQWSPAEVDSSGMGATALQLNEAEVAKLKDLPPTYQGGGQWLWPAHSTPQPQDELPLIGLPFQGDEVRIVDPETGGEKGQKLARYDLLPVEALRQVAIHYGLGARKYEDRNWEKGYAWGLSYGAAMRHLNDFWQGTDWDDDPTLGQPTRHLAAAAFHVLALLHFSTMNVGTDDRTKAVHVGRSIIAEILAEDLLTVSDKPRQGGFKVSDEHHNAFADQYRQKARDTENAWKVSPPLGDL